MNSYKSRVTLLFILFSSLLSSAQNNKPALTETYAAASRVRSGIAMGGIGTGSIEIRKDGNFYNWSIFNNYPYGSGPMLDLPVIPGKSLDQSFMFFLVRYQVEGEKPHLKLLQLNNSLQEAGMEGIVYYYPWMSGVDNIQYSARFPFSNLVFTDAEMPFVVEMEAFSPFIPHDVKNSSLPGIYFNFKVRSKISKKIDVMLLGSLRNLVGYDKISKAFESRLIENKAYKFFVHSVSGMDQNSSSYGQMGMGVVGGDEVSYYLGWEHKHPYYEKLLVESKLPNIDDTKNRNFKSNEGIEMGRIGGWDNDQRCFSSIAVSKKLNENEEFTTTFLVNWFFPNSYGSVMNDSKKNLEEREKKKYEIELKISKKIGHDYQNTFPVIDSVANYFVLQQKMLQAKTYQFVNDMYTSDLDQFVLDQVNSQLNTFITSSTLTKNGQFAIREGLTSSQAWGPNATTDVALYGSPMIIALFPELQKSMMKAHCKLQTVEGEINHGLGGDLDFNENGTWGVYNRIDLVPNYIQLVLRDYLFTNDKKYITEMWPSIKKGIDYILTKCDKDGDQMPDMHGIMCSYDNFPMYGLSSYIQSQWIVALRMASEVAPDMGDKVLSKKYNDIADKGSMLMESKLWNGSYYNLSNDYLGKKGVNDGCLTDQLIGQWVADNAGMGYIFRKENVQKSLKSILSRSFMDNSFLRNCSWPATPDLFPIHTSDLWVDQANTPWSGVELAFASFLIYENMVDEGLNVIKAVDNRYRTAGLYFDHQEFGGHYFRPMAAWSLMNAFLGFSVNRGQLNFNPKLRKEKFSLFFASSTATALYKKEQNKIRIEVKTGNLTFKKLCFESSEFNMQKPHVYIDNQKSTLFEFSKKDSNIIFTSKSSVNVAEGAIIEIK